VGGGRKAKKVDANKAKVGVLGGEAKKDDGSRGGRRDIALTVRIEINLPANGTPETYDSIFKSVRANFFDE